MTEPVTRLFLCRHGEVEERYHRVFGGRIDMDLSKRGHAHAAALAAYLKRHTFDGFYASPMVRARDTAKPIADLIGQQPTVMMGLREVDFGDWTGLAWNQVVERFQVSAFQWLEQMETSGFPNGDSATTFHHRVAPCLWEILENHRGKSAVIVCHGGVIRMALSILLQLPLKTFAHFEVDYASVTEVQISPSKTEVHLMNLTPWRDID